MEKETFKKIENFMLENCGEAAHDKGHIYRVLYNALEIAKNEKDVDLDILITACLLHDIGRAKELSDKSIDHAVWGSEVAYKWLKENSFSEEFSRAVSECILCHRYRGENIPKTVEAKILYDSDKIDACGLIGIARTLEYKGVIGEPIYTVKNGKIENGNDKTNQSFFTEYINKLSKIEAKLTTEKGRKIAKNMQKQAEEFYNSLYGYLDDLYCGGNKALENILT